MSERNWNDEFWTIISNDRIAGNSWKSAEELEEIWARPRDEQEANRKPRRGTYDIAEHYFADPYPDPGD
jgi:hypothetical protein